MTLYSRKLWSVLIISSGVSWGALGITACSSSGDAQTQLVKARSELSAAKNQVAVDAAKKNVDIAQRDADLATHAPQEVIDADNARIAADTNIEATDAKEQSKAMDRVRAANKAYHEAIDAQIGQVDTGTQAVATVSTAFGPYGAIAALIAGLVGSIWKMILTKKKADADRQDGLDAIEEITTQINGQSGAVGVVAPTVHGGIDMSRLSRKTKRLIYQAHGAA